MNFFKFFLDLFGFLKIKIKFSSYADVKNDAAAE